MRAILLTAWILPLLLGGCSTDPDKVVDGIMGGYGLMASSLGPETKCEDGEKIVQNFWESGRNKARKNLDDFNALTRDNKKKVIATLTEQVRTLNKKYWVPFRERCPYQSPRVGKLLGGYMRRFGVE